MINKIKCWLGWHDYVGKTPTPHEQSILDKYYLRNDFAQCKHCYKIEFKNKVKWREGSI